MSSDPKFKNTELPHRDPKVLFYFSPLIPTDKGLRKVRVSYVSIPCHHDEPTAQLDSILLKKDIRTFSNQTWEIWRIIQIGFENQCTPPVTTTSSGQVCTDSSPHIQIRQYILARCARVRGLDRNDLTALVPVLGSMARGCITSLYWIDIVQYSWE